jgi:hypothetical protein
MNSNSTPLTFQIHALKANTVPEELAELISQPVWEDICQRAKGLRNEALCVVCALEWLACAAFMFPFVFCCHMCFVDSVTSHVGESADRNLNKLHFGGFPVIRIFGVSTR